jgi:hypothetical protein
MRKRRVFESGKPPGTTAALPVLRVVLVVLALVLSSSGTAHAETTTTFYHTGSEQTIAIPAGVTRAMVTAVGGKGGPGANGGEYAGSAPGGYGAMVSGWISVTPTSTLIVEVAGTGRDSGDSGGGGGGASDVRTSASLASRLLVAAGGGGGGIPGGGNLSGGAGGNASQAGETGRSDTGGSYGGQGGGAGNASGGGLGGTGGQNDDPSATPSGTPGGLGFGGGPGRCGEYLCVEGEGGGGGGGDGLYGGGGGGTGGHIGYEGGGSGGGGGGSSLVPTGGTFAIDTTGVPMIQITIPTPVKEESEKEESKQIETKKEETPTPSISATTLTRPIVPALVPATTPAPGVRPTPIKHELSKAQLLAKELAKCKKIKNKRKRAKCVAAAKKRYPAKKE